MSMHYTTGQLSLSAPQAEDTPKWIEHIAQDHAKIDAFAGDVTQKIENLFTLQIVPGSILAGVWQTAPDGWLLCNGQAVSRTTYSNLFDVIGVTFGTGDGSTTFNLPDMQGKVLAGYKSSSADNIFGTFGATIGEETQELQAHFGNIDNNLNRIGFDRVEPSTTLWGNAKAFDSNNIYTGAITKVNDGVRVARSDNDGNASTIQPTIIINYAIKY